MKSPTFNQQLSLPASSVPILRATEYGNRTTRRFKSVPLCDVSTCCHSKASHLTANATGQPVREPSSRFDDRRHCPTVAVNLDVIRGDQALEQPLQTSDGLRSTS